MSDYPDGFEGFAGKPTSDAIDARGFIGQRNYRTTRELEAFVHGAMAGLDT
jgi:hypothetical protein